MPEASFRRYARFFARESPMGLERAIAENTAAVYNSRFGAKSVVSPDQIMPTWWGSKSRKGSRMTDEEWDTFLGIATRGEPIRR